jgi:hypothetical protein
VAIGPATDGGLYLLASLRPLGNFVSQVRWCGPHARADLTRSLASAGLRVILLETLADLDTREDLESWLTERHTRDGWIGLVRRLRISLARLHVRAGRFPMPRARRLSRRRDGRAPPPQVSSQHLHPTN